MQPIESCCAANFYATFSKHYFFIKIALKSSYFCKKMQNFRALGAPPSDPQNSPPLRISGYVPVSAGFHLKSGNKSAPFLGRPLIGLYLIYFTEKNRCRGSSPQCSTKIGTPANRSRPKHILNDCVLGLNFLNILVNRLKLHNLPPPGCATSCFIFVLKVYEVV